MSTLLMFGIPILIVLGPGALGFFIAIALRRVVPTNMVHIVQSAKKTISYGAGQPAGNTYYEWPSFIPVIGVVTSKYKVSNFDINLKSYEAFDHGRLPFRVDVTGFFAITDSDLAAKRVSTFDELQLQLKAILEGSVRSTLANHKLEDILGMRQELGQTFTGQVEEQLKAWGVAPVKTIEFMNMYDVQDSTVIHDIAAKDQERIRSDSRVAIANQQQIAETREIEMRREIDLRKQDAAQVVGQRTAEAEKAVGIAREQSQQEVLEQERHTMERTMQVRQVEQVKIAEIAREVAEVAAQQDKNVAVVDAEATRTTEVIRAEAEKTKTTLIAEGQLAAAKNEAEGIKVTGEAKAKAEELMLQAPVTAQITLAKEIGSNDNYQHYLLGDRQIRANESIGIEMAKAMGGADLKVIANTSDGIPSGLNSIGQLFSSKGGQAIASMLEGLGQTESGKELVNRVNGTSGTADETTLVPPTPPQAKGRRGSSSAN